MTIFSSFQAEKRGQLASSLPQATVKQQNCAVEGYEKNASKHQETTLVAQKEKQKKGGENETTTKTSSRRGGTARAFLPFPPAVPFCVTVTLLVIYHFQFRILLFVAMFLLYRHESLHAKRRELVVLPHFYRFPTLFFFHSLPFSLSFVIEMPSHASPQHSPHPNHNRSTHISPCIYRVLQAAVARAYLCADVLKRRRANDGKANKKHVRLGVRQRAQAVVIFLASRVPKTQVDGLAVHHDVCGVVVKHGGNVLAREGVCGVGNEQARLANGAVTHNHTLDGLHLDE